MTDDRTESLHRFLAQMERRALVMAELSTQNREEALDLVQDTMLAFARRYAHKDATEWPPLFYRILQNRIRDWFRRSQVQKRWRVWLRGDADTNQNVDQALDPVQTLADPAHRLPEDALDTQATMAQLMDELQQLPERQRQAVLLRIWEGFDVTETAQTMGCSAGSVKTHLSRGLARLRQALELNR